MVGAGAIVLYPAAELGEDHEHHIFPCIVLFQVVIEVANGTAGLAPKPGMGGQLTGVGVKTVEGGCGVKHPGAEPSQMGLHNVAHVLADSV